MGQSIHKVSAFRNSALLGSSGFAHQLAALMIIAIGGWGVSAAAHASILPDDVPSTVLQLSSTQTGTVTCAEFSLAADEELIATGDLKIMCSGSARIAGAITALPGVSVEIMAGDALEIVGSIKAGDGASAIRVGSRGGDGGSIRLTAGKIFLRGGSLLAGKGGDGALAGAGGSGGSIEIHAETGSVVPETVARAGAGGAGGSGVAFPESGAEFPAGVGGDAGNFSISVVTGIEIEPPTELCTDGLPGRNGWVVVGARGGAGGAGKSGTPGIYTLVDGGAGEKGGNGGNGFAYGGGKGHRGGDCCEGAGGFGGNGGVGGSGIGGDGGDGLIPGLGGIGGPSGAVTPGLGGTGGVGGAPGPSSRGSSGAPGVAGVNGAPGVSTNAPVAGTNGVGGNPC